MAPERTGKQRCCHRTLRWKTALGQGHFGPYDLATALMLMETKLEEPESIKVRMMMAAVMMTMAVTTRIRKRDTTGFGKDRVQNGGSHQEAGKSEMRPPEATLQTGGRPPKPRTPLWELYQLMLTARHVPKIIAYPSEHGDWMEGTRPSHA